jgi:SMI1 / KNR4 family (SUKH-1)
VEAIVLRQLFPNGRFSAAATLTQIESVEADLGVRLPEQLRRLYLECDGFREDRGNAKYLLSLTEQDSIGSLLLTTRFWWDEWKRYHPALDFRPFVFFGFSSGDECWGINWQRAGEIIAYHHHMEGRYEVVGADILELYRADYARYDEVVGGAEPNSAPGRGGI